MLVSRFNIRTQAVELPVNARVTRGDKNTLIRNHRKHPRCKYLSPLHEPISFANWTGAMQIAWCLQFYQLHRKQCRRVNAAQLPIHLVPAENSSCKYLMNNVLLWLHAFVHPCHCIVVIAHTSHLSVNKSCRLLWVGRGAAASNKSLGKFSSRKMFIEQAWGVLLVNEVMRNNLELFIQVENWGCLSFFSFVG